MNQQLEDLRSFIATLERVAPKMRVDEALKELSSAEDAEVEVDLAEPLYPFQRAGVAYALKQRRVIIGDEMGLGKTPQGIAVCAHAAKEGLRSLVVVPPSLRINWERSFAKFAPWLSVTVLKGNKPYRFPMTDVVIIGDSNVNTWSTTLAGKRFGCLVVDEAHRAKNGASGRTKGIAWIAQNIPYSGYVVLLSGTIIVNRPNELVSPLAIIGRLDKVFGSCSSFLQRYCDPKHNGFGWVFNGASNTAELNEILRGTCYVRRKKMDVLKELPAKRRAQYAVEIDDGDIASYRHAEEDFKDFVLSNGGKEAWQRVAKAEVISRLTALRRLLGLAKVSSVVDHVNELVEQGEQVILFAHHKDVIAKYSEALAEHKVVKVVGGLSDQQKDEAVSKFQSGEARVFIGQFTAAGVGLTLTSSSNVVFGEIPWTPAEATQSEDRAHRIGQENAVVAWWLLATDPENPTIDDRLWGLLNFKHETVSAVLDGLAADLGAEGSTAQAIIEGILGS